MNAIKKFIKTPMLIVFLIMLIFVTPSAVVSPGENRNRAVVTAVGIDRNGEDLEISFLTFIPTANQSYKETNSVISGKGRSVAEAVYDAELTLGRTIGLSHARTTVVSEDILNDDITSYIDFLSRISALPENSVLISTNDTAKEFLITAQSLAPNIGLKLEQLIHFNAQNIYVTDTTIESFYNGYYSDEKASIIGYLSLENLQNTPGQVTTSKDTSSSGGGSGSSGGSSGGEGGGSGGNSGGGGSGDNSQGGTNGSGGESGEGGGDSAEDKGPKQIWNKGETLILKEGKKVIKLSEKELNGLNIINQKASNQTIFLENVTDGVHNGSNLTYIIRNKQVRTATKFINGYPIFKVNLDVGVELMEVNSKGKSIEINTEFSEITPRIESLIQNSIRKQFADSINLLRENKTDILGIAKQFKNENFGEFQKFLSRLEDPEDYLRYITFKFAVDVQSD
jgi:hypothetical protein